MDKQKIIENRKKKEGIPNFGGNLVLTGYDTERDLNKAKKDIERMLMLVASESIFEIIKFLAPYRKKMAKIEAGLENEQTNKKP